LFDFFPKFTEKLINMRIY